MLVFTKADALVAWMHDEYLSELLLRKLSPKPRARAPKGGAIAMEWGLAIPGEDRKLASYLVKAESVTVWALDGEWDPHAELELRSVVDRDGIAIEMAAPGRLTLVCERLAIERGPMRRYTPPVAPNPDRALFFGPREVTWSELWEWIAPADGLGLYRQRAGRNELVTPEVRPMPRPCYDTFRVQRDANDERPQLFVSIMQAIGATGHYFSVGRGESRELWSRVVRLPRELGECTVMSGRVRCSGDEWLARWAPIVA